MLHLINSFCTTCLLCLFNPFIEFAFGEKYLFDLPLVLLICLDFYVRGMRVSFSTIKETCGIFRPDRYKPILEAIVNLTLSILLVKPIGFAWNHDQHNSDYFAALLYHRNIRHLQICFCQFPLVLLPHVLSKCFCTGHPVVCHLWIMFLAAYVWLHCSRSQSVCLPDRSQPHQSGSLLPGSGFSRSAFYCKTYAASENFPKTPNRKHNKVILVKSPASHIKRYESRGFLLYDLPKLLFPIIPAF